jgi:hypothetical protein
MIVAVFLNGWQERGVGFAGDAKDVEQINVIKKINARAAAGCDCGLELAAIVGFEHVAIHASSQRGCAVGGFVETGHARVDDG